MTGIGTRKQVNGNKRWWLWLPLLGLGIWLALFGDKSPVDNAAPSLPTRAPALVAGRADTFAATSQAKTKAAATEVLVPLIAREELIAGVHESDVASKAPMRDLFSVRSWNPPPAPVPLVVAQPVAPPLPFNFLGKKLEGDAWEVYLGRGEQTYIVREGQVLDGLYRVDKIEPPTLALTYLPLGQAQTLPIGETR